MSWSNPGKHTVRPDKEVDRDGIVTVEDIRRTHNGQLAHFLIDYVSRTVIVRTIPDDFLALLDEPIPTKENGQNGLSPNAQYNEDPERYKKFIDDYVPNKLKEHKMRLTLSNVARVIRYSGQFNWWAQQNPAPLKNNSVQTVSVETLEEYDGEYTSED